MAGLSSDDIKKLIREHVSKVLEEDEEYRVLGLGPKDRDQLDLHVENVSLLKSDYMEELALNEYKNMKGHVDVLLEEKQVALDRGGSSYKLLCREMLKAVINLLEIEGRRCQSDYSFEALPFPELLPPSPSTQLRRRRLIMFTQPKNQRSCSPRPFQRVVMYSHLYYVRSV